jgi:hypothetical protein
VPPSATLLQAAAAAEPLTGMRSLFFVLLLGISVAANATPPPLHPPTFGIAEVGGDRWPCAVISSDDAYRGEYVTVVLLSERPRMIAARLGPETTVPCSATGASGKAFLLSLDDGPEVIARDIGLVLDRSQAKVTVLRHGEWLLLSNPPKIIRRCMSTEGIHLSVTIGEKTVWDEYYYLGYDVEPTCPESSR